MQTLDKVQTALGAEILVGSQLSERQVTGGYACDMLSWVMSRAQPTDVWMTILNSINVIAVAVLTDCACVLLTEGVELPPEVAARAEEKGIIVLQTKESTYEASARLHQFLNQKL